MATAGRYALMMLTGIAIGFVATRWLNDSPADMAIRETRPPASPAAVWQSIDDSSSNSRGPVAPRTRAASDAQSLAEISGISSDFTQTLVLYDLASNASATQLERLLEEAAGLNQFSESGAATSILYARYAELDPQAAVAYLLDSGSPFTEQSMSSIFHAWSRQDLNAAIEGVRALDIRWQPVAGFALLNARDDLPDDQRHSIAIDLQIEHILADQDRRRQALLASSDPEAAWQIALSTANPELKEQGLHTIATLWAQRDPLTALEAVSLLSEPGLRERLTQQILARWAQSDPHAAVDWALTLIPSNQRSRSLAITLGTLAKKDPPTAVIIADSLSGREWLDAVEQISHGWASTDPRAAAEWWSDLDVPSSRGHAVYTIARSYAQRYPEEAFDWALSLPLTQSGMALQSTLHSIASKDPVYASQLAGRITNPNVFDDAANTVVQIWAASDPDATGDWIGGLRNKKIHGPLYQTMLQSWSQHDPQAAVAYLDRIRSADDRDAAILGLMQRYPDDVPYEDLYQKIQNPARRRQAAHQLSRMLESADPARAAEFRGAAGINNRIN